MRICDEYCRRMGLKPLFMRHSSKAFMFFDDGQKLLSIKWLGSASAMGRYEFFESVLGKTINVANKMEVEWSSYEKELRGWLSSRSGFIFDESLVFRLMWEFFIKRHDRFLSEKYDPFLIFSTMNRTDVSSIKSAERIVAEICSASSEASSFWTGKVSPILKNYAYWLKDWS